MGGGQAPEPLVPLSAIEHYAYCPRQCALIHVEQTYQDNVYTIRGQLAHERVHGGETTSETGVQVYRAVALYSDRLGLVGRADLVEMRANGPYPVEYKSGRVHRAPAEQQLCGQALCLEEMYGRRVLQGAVYSVATRTRREVSITEELCLATIKTIESVRDMLVRLLVPAPVDNERLCRRCSLLEVCLPGPIRERARLRGLQGALYRITDREEMAED